MRFPLTHRPAFALFRLIIAAALIFSSPVTEAASAHRGQITHVILFWLKRSGNIDDQNVLARAAQAFRRTRGVTEVRVGRPLSVERSDAQQPFDLGILITFRDCDAFQKFERDRRREQVMETGLHPLVRRYVSYSFINE